MNVEILARKIQEQCLFCVSQVGCECRLPNTYRGQNLFRKISAYEDEVLVTLTTLFNNRDELRSSELRMSWKITRKSGIFAAQTFDLVDATWSIKYSGGKRSDCFHGDENSTKRQI